jgi:hypothetical protein
VFIGVCSNYIPDIAQLVERSTVGSAGIEWSLVRFRVSGFGFLSPASNGGFVCCAIHIAKTRRNNRLAVNGLSVRDSIVVSISACHADDPGSIPGRGAFSSA